MSRTTKKLLIPKRRTVIKYRDKRKSKRILKTETNFTFCARSARSLSGRKNFFDQQSPFQRFLPSTITYMTCSKLRRPSSVHLVLKLAESDLTARMGRAGKEERESKKESRGVNIGENYNMQIGPLHCGVPERRA